MRLTALLLTLFTLSAETVARPEPIPEIEINPEAEIANDITGAY